ncbi:TetR/AcrR family transcriptional regulator [Salinibacterium hongtaonis]|uniref:TetR family transcriptional regulator n=1 Tax=Homoserinimonas hongtaonis TaxID=2079791 RepID=A0A2U1SZ56_9MICO|nr:TetR/AcrR family transcriptional regulator [Salinibacterium hongtaonis]PWB96915.1 TetR family transcriptional regulator [Salinibacterium hongtaonis]
MTPTSASGRGRPPAASREMLQDAAFELFLENGYAGTTVEHIAQRAGVSRNTFFNYFEAKGDVFWVEFDEAIDAAQADLASIQASDPLAAIRHALLHAAASLGPSRVPFALTQHDLIGSTHELLSSGIGRVTRLAAILRDAQLACGEQKATATAYALTGAVVAAAQLWARAGSERGAFTPFVEAAIDPVLAGYAATAHGSVG